jgi:hypothetical protein
MPAANAPALVVRSLRWSGASTGIAQPDEQHAPL